jgi:hypothetical protein
MHLPSTDSILFWQVSFSSKHNQIVQSQDIGVFGHLEAPAMMILGDT